MTEKRIAILSSLLSFLIIAGYGALSSYFSNNSLDLTAGEIIEFALLNMGTLIIPFVLACLPYLFVRPAAVTGSTLSVLLIFAITAVISASTTDPKSAAATWAIYIFWLLGSTIASLAIAVLKPKFFTASAMRSFLLSIVFALVVGFAIGLTISKLL
ncbi:TPA: hypothetical protein QB352_001044 [Pasteurella multocida]|nr:hypothetical protein [Pasteurella multocida]